MRSAKVAVLILATVALATANSATATDYKHQTNDKQKRCNTQRCKMKRDRIALRKKVDHEAIPVAISNCESATSGGYRAYNSSSGAGGKYQILPSTWRSYLHQVSLRVIKLAEMRPNITRSRVPLAHRATSLLQDIVARKIWNNDGPSAWSCS